jgi:uncharacterized membrane protein
MMTKIMTWGLALMIMLLALPLVAAGTLPISIEQTKIDGFDINNSQFKVERGDDIEFKVKFTTSKDLTDIDVNLDVSGYKYGNTDPINARKHIRNINANDSEPVTLHLDLPDDVEDDFYTLRLSISDRTDIFEQTFKLHIDQADTLVRIVDVIINPANDIKGGGTLLAFARVENQGDQKEKNVRVTISLPELGQSQTAFIDDIDQEDEEESPELLLRIPRCTQAGLYDLVTQVKYDDRREQTQSVQQIRITPDNTCTTTTGPTTVVTGVNLATIAQGQGVVFPFMITNGEPTAQAFTITITGLEDWANVRVSPGATLVLDSAEQATFYVFTTANKNAAQGPKTFMATISSGGEIIEQLSITANVVKGKSTFTPTQTILAAFLILLLIILVIVAIMLGFNRNNKTKSYY